MYINSARAYDLASGIVAMLADLYLNTVIEQAVDLIS